jgi:DnaK suppressor protein
MEIHGANQSAAALLETRRRRLLATTEELGRPGYEPVETFTESIDVAQIATERDTSEALRNLFGDLQQDVERALTRLETGGYGICEECSESISVERMRTLPEATRCVICQSHYNHDARLKASA